MVLSSPAVDSTVWWLVLSDGSLYESSQCKDEHTNAMLNPGNGFGSGLLSKGEVKLMLSSSRWSSFCSCSSFG